MSCQQAPRLAEDPYTFTEAPLTTTYFTSPIQKLSSIKSTNKFGSQQKDKTIPACSPKAALVQLPNPPKYFMAPSQQVIRLNGSANGLQSKGEKQPIYFKHPAYQSTPPAQQQPQIRSKASDSGQAVSVTNVQQILKSTPPTQSAASIISVPNKVKVTFSTPDGKSLQTISSKKSQPPNIQMAKVKPKINNTLNHSKVNEASSTTLLLSSSSITPTSTTSSTSASSFIPIHPCNSVSPHQSEQIKQKVLPHPIPSNQHNKYQSKSQQQQETATTKPQIPATGNQSKANDQVKLKPSKSSTNSSQGSINDAHAVAPTATATSTDAGKAGKKQATAEKVKKVKNVAKAEKANKKSKLTNNGKTPAENGKRKRSYSQTSHHEALQRIPLKGGSSSTTAPVAAHGANASSGSSSKGAPKRAKREWHAPDSYIYDDFNGNDANDGVDDLDVGKVTQTHWFSDTHSEKLLTREQRIEMKRDNLRRQASQYAQALSFRSTTAAKRRLVAVIKTLAKFENERNKNEPAKCSIQGCSNDALAMTAYCYLHITLNTDQKLFHPCTAKFSDNSQCRVPVFDISHELPLCHEHAWKRDNYNRMIQEQKPKKNVRKKIKASAINQLPKRNKKKKKQHQVLPEVPNVQQKQQPPINAPPPITVKQPKFIPVNSVPHLNQMIQKVDNTAPQHIIATMPAITTSNMINAKLLPANHVLTDNITLYQFANSMHGLSNVQQHTDLLSVCENSSAYESSEDTGVGGLSESELIGASDGIEIPLGDARLLEEHDLTNVLNQLPEDAFNELFEVQQNDPYEPTQKEQDELARALEEVDEQVKSLEQMTSSNFLDNFLNVDDEILVDGSDICTEVLTTTPAVKNDIRGLVHT